MILTPTILKSFGLKIDGAIPDATLTTAITDAEQLIVKAAIGEANLAAIEALSDTDPVIVGGNVADADGVQHYFVGMRRAISYIAFSRILAYDNIAATSYGTVQKKDEFSEQRDPFMWSKMYEADGLAYVRALCLIKGWKYTTPFGQFTEGL